MDNMQTHAKIISNLNCKHLVYTIRYQTWKIKPNNLDHREKYQQRHIKLLPLLLMVQT